MVTEKKFTKGEWKIEQSDHIGAINVSFGDFKGGIECWYHHGDTLTKEEAEANAKLIAAAPELLEVSIKCLQWCNSAMSPEFVNKLRIEAESAIKKATE